MARLPPVRCPQCRKRYRLPTSFENRQVVCKRCQHQFLVQIGEATTSPSVSDDVASIFDSLDVDGLLNAPTSGLEKSKRRAKQEEQRPQPTQSPTPQPPISQQAKPEPEPKDVQQGKSSEQDLPEASDPDPRLIEQELEFAWAKQRKAKNFSANQQRKFADAERAKLESGVDNREPELDDEELAIYAAVTRHNRRKNFIWAIIAAIVAISVGGFFAQHEYAALAKPLSQAERDWLIERGFVLKASHVAKANDGVNVGVDDGAAVTVAAGKSFADVDRFGRIPDDARENGNQKNGLERIANAASGERQNGRLTRAEDQRRNRQPVRRDNRTEKALPKVDFDTNVDVAALTSAPIGPFHQIPFRGNAVATFSPRGHAYIAGRRFIKSVANDGEVFDQRTLESPSFAVTAIVASPDGRYVIVGDDTGVVQAYRVDVKGRLSPSWKLRQIHHEKIIRLRVSTDSTKLVVYSADGRLSIWEFGQQLIELNLSDLVPEVRLSSFQLTDDAILIGSSESLRQIRLGQSTVQQISFDKRYRLMASDKSGNNTVVSDGKSISAISTGSKQIKWVQTIRIADRGRIEFSPDGETAFYYDGGRDVLHFEIVSGHILQRYGNVRVDSVHHVAVSFDGTKLLTSGDSDAVQIYRVEDSEPLAIENLKAPLPAPTRVYPPAVAEDDVDVVTVASANVTNENVSAICLSNNGFLIAAEQERIIVYDWTTDRIAYERFEARKDKITAMTTLGNRLVLGRSSGMVQVGEIETDGKLSNFKDVAGHLEPVRFIVAIAEAGMIASVTDSGHTRVWNIETLKTVYVGKPIESKVQSVVVDRRSDLLLADGIELATLDYQSGNVRQKKGDARLRSVTILPDGKRLAFFDRGKLNFATTSRGEINLSIDLPKGASSVAFSPDSKLAFVFAEEKVVVYRLRGGKEIFSFAIDSRSNAATEMIFSADEKFMTPLNRGSKGSFKIYATPSP